MKKTNNTENNPQPQWLMGGNPNAIEAQEAEGQKELVASLQLPRKCNSPRGINTATQYHKMGIKVFTTSKGDDLFLGVKLPDGWKKEATDHSMWNNLLDDKGRVRATFFYTAAFYDRDAFVNFSTRYNWNSNYEDKDNVSYFVKDNSTGKIVFETEKMSRDVKQPDYFKIQDELQNQCKQFLKDKFPEHEDINAYWD